MGNCTNTEARQTFSGLLLFPAKKQIPQGNAVPPRTIPLLHSFIIDRFKAAANSAAAVYEIVR